MKPWSSWKTIKESDVEALKASSIAFKLLIRPRYSKTGF